MRKIGFFCGALITALFVASNPAFAYRPPTPPATLTVCSTCAYTTIQSAVDAANNGDTIQVKAGTYTESVTVNKQVKILGAGKFKTSVQAPDASSSGFMVMASHVVIRGFTIQGGTATDGVYIGWSDSLGEAHNVTVEYCTVERSGIGIGIYPGAADVRLSYNVIRYNMSLGAGIFAGTGILLSSWDIAPHMSNVVIDHNQINDNEQDGIAVHSGNFSGLQLLYNTLLNNGSNDLDPPHYYNKYGFYFYNAYGPITMNYNKILATSIPGNELRLFGLVTELTGTGNVIFNYYTGPMNMVGPGTPLTLP